MKRHVRASDAYSGPARHLTGEVPDRRSVLLAEARQLYQEHGLSALATDFLNRSGVSEGKLRRVGLSHAGLLAELDLTEEYARWRNETFTYAGKPRPRWTWKRAIEVARELIARERDLPTVAWCRTNGYAQLTNTVHRLGRDWEDLRVATGLPRTVSKSGRPRYFESRAGIRWRSRPEACLSNFLYARGIEHKRGERYPVDYAKESGRKYGRYDLHFVAQTGEDIDVEIWGDIPDALSKGRYSVTRAKKEAYHEGRTNFLGLHYLDCQSERRLTELLAQLHYLPLSWRPADRTARPIHRGHRAFSIRQGTRPSYRKRPLVRRGRHAEHLPADRDGTARRDFP